MTEEQLQAIKERAERVDPNRYDANNSFHSQLDVPALIAEVERLRKGLETIANHNIFKVPQIIMRDYAREVLEGEKP